MQVAIEGGYTGNVPGRKFATLKPVRALNDFAPLDAKQAIEKQMAFRKEAALAKLRNVARRPKRIKQYVAPPSPDKNTPFFSTFDNIPVDAFNVKKVESGPRENVRQQMNSRQERIMREIQYGLKNRAVYDSSVSQANASKAETNKQTLARLARAAGIAESGHFVSLVEQKFTDGEIAAMLRFPSKITDLLRRMHHLTVATMNELPDGWDQLNDTQRNAAISEVLLVGYERLADDMVQCLPASYAASTLLGRNRPGYEVPHVARQLMVADEDDTGRMRLMPTPISPFGVPDGQFEGDQDLEDVAQEDLGIQEDEQPLVGQPEESKKSSVVVEELGESEFEIPEFEIKIDDEDPISVDFGFATRSTKDFRTLRRYYEEISPMLDISQQEEFYRKLMILREAILEIHRQKGNINAKTFATFKNYEAAVLNRYLSARDERNFPMLFFDKDLNAEMFTRSELIRNIIKGTLFRSSRESDFREIPPQEGVDTQGFGIKKLFPKRKTLLTAKEKRALKKAGNDSL